MTHFIGICIPANGRVFTQAKRINTGKEHEHAKIIISRPMRRDIRTVPADKPVD